MKTYEVYWTEVNEFFATIHAESLEEARAIFEEGNYEQEFLQGDMDGEPAFQEVER